MKSVHCRLIQKGKRKWFIARKLASLVLFILIILKVFLQLHAPFQRNLVDSVKNKTTSDGYSNFTAHPVTCALQFAKHPVLRLSVYNATNFTVPSCNRWERLFTYEDSNEEVISLAPVHRNSDCSIQNIQRGKLSHQEYSISLSQPLSNIHNISKYEFFAINCSGKIHLDARLPQSAAVKAKINHWTQPQQEEPDKPVPMSIIVLGIASTSRAQFHRSLPHTVEVLKKFNFTEFEAYHSLSRKPHDDVIKILTGLAAAMKVKRHSPSSRHLSIENFVDEWPFVWQYFDNNEYVTMYNDDSNWLASGVGGFKFKPTDYYSYPIYAAQRALIKDVNKKDANQREPCMSVETIPHFSLRYIQRFFDKFRQVPFASFNWLSTPFNSNPIALQNFDDDLEQFIRHLESHRKQLERTLVIITSDQGYRYGNQHAYTAAGALEKSLPVLFMRIPESILTCYPRSQEILQLNSARLITAYDLHSTLIHTLSMDFPDYFGDKIASFAPSGVGLFNQVVPHGRDCHAVGIKAEDGCICGINAVDGHPYNVSEIQKDLLRFISDDLNKYWSTQTGCYKNSWLELHPDQPILGAQNLNGNKTHTNLIVFFKIDIQAEFQVLLWLVRDGVNVEFNRVGPYVRLDDNAEEICESW